MLKLLKSQSVPPVPQEFYGKTDSTLGWTEFLFDPDDPDVVPTTLLPRHMLRRALRHSRSGTQRCRK